MSAFLIGLCAFGIMLGVLLCVADYSDCQRTKNRGGDPTEDRSVGVTGIFMLLFSVIILIATMIGRAFA